MADIKLKRGLQSKVSSLPKEDGSLIFGYDAASVPATIHLDQQINGDIKRLDLSVASANTSNYAYDSKALGGSSLQEITDLSGNGSAFINVSGDGSDTLHFLQANNGTVNFTVNNVAYASSALLSSTAKVSNNSISLGGSSLQNIIDKINQNTGSGNAFTEINTETNNLIKLTRANGATVQKIIDNVSNASTSLYSLNSSQLQGYSLTNVSSGSSLTFSNKIPFINNGALEISRYLDFHGDEVSRNYSIRLDSGNVGNLIISSPANGTTVTADYFNGISKNSNALGGSSLQQILEQINSGASTKYLPLEGGTLLGPLYINSISSPQLIINNYDSGDTIFNLNRGQAADWRFLSNNDGLKIQTNYTIDKGNFYDVFTLQYNSGNALIKGTATATSFIGMLARNGQKVSWQDANKGKGVLINQTSYSGWNPILRTKTENGVWTFGPNENNSLYLNYTSDETIASTKDACDRQIAISPFGDLSGLNDVSASTFSGYLNGVSSDSNALGGSSLQQILDSFNSGNVSADSATRIVSSSKSVPNNFTIRTGIPNQSGWSQYPVSPIQDSLDPDLINYKSKSLSVLHMDGGTYRHDIVALNESNDGLLYATASSLGGSSSRIARIFDSGNYGSLITNLSKQVTFANGLRAQKNLYLDGGNYSIGSTVGAEEQEHNKQNVNIYVSGSTLIITTI